MLWFALAERTWPLSQKDLVFAVIMVGMLLLGMYVLFRLMVTARHTEPILEGNMPTPEGDFPAASRREDAL